MNSNTDVELVPDWLDRFPFNAMAYSLAAPLSLHDGHKLCHYIGMLVSGINTMNLTGSQPSPLPNRGKERESFRRRRFRVHSLREYPCRARLAGLIDSQIAIAGEVGHSAGQELPVLIPLSLSLLL